MKAYITKYALTAGIKLKEGEPYEGDQDRFSVAGDWSSYSRSDWHEDPETALRQAEHMRAQRLASLRRQIAKLEKLVFKVPEG